MTREEGVNAMQDPGYDPNAQRQEDAPAQPAPDVAPQVTDPGPAATAANGAEGAGPAAGPDSSPTSEDAAGAEVEAEPLPYRPGMWSGYPIMVCTWVLPNGTECEAGFLKDEEFWSHHRDHVIREMTPEERASLVEAMRLAQQPSAAPVLVRPDGSPLGR